VTSRVRGALQLAQGKQEVYRDSVAAALRDLIALMRDPTHGPRVTLADGARAVAIACAAADPDVVISDEWF